MLCSFSHKNIVAYKEYLVNPRAWYFENNEKENYTYQSAYLRQGGYDSRKQVNVTNSETDARRNMGTWN